MRYSIGIDISAGEIRLVQLYYKNPSMVEIKLSAKTSFNPEAIIDGRIKDQSAVVMALTHLVEKTNAKNKKVSIALPHQCVISKRLKLPCHLQEKERIAEIIAHLKQYLPGIHDEVSFDFIEVNREEDVQEWALFATRRTHLEDYLSIVVKSGLRVRRIDLDVYAFMRGVKWHQNFNRYMAVLHFNHLIRFIVTDGNEVMFTRCFTEVNSVSQLAQEIKTILEIHAVPMHKIEQILAIGETSFNLNELSKEAAVNIQQIEVGEKKLAVTSDFLIAFGLALGVKNV